MAKKTEQVNVLKEENTMGHLASLSEKGFDTKVMETMAKFGCSDDAQSELLSLIDANGLPGGPTVLKTATQLKAKKQIKVDGLYPALAKLGAEFNSAKKTNGAAVETTTENTEKKTEETVDVSNFSFTADQEAKIKERMAREEERLRARLQKREKTIREAVATGKPLVSHRGKKPSGVPEEQLARWAELNEMASTAKRIRKEQGLILKQVKAERETIRPTRERAKRSKKAKAE